MPNAGSRPSCLRGQLRRWPRLAPRVASHRFAFLWKSSFTRSMPVGLNDHNASHREPAEDTVFEKFKRIKKLLIALAVLGSLGLAGFGMLAWKPAIARIVPPAAASFAP